MQVPGVGREARQFPGLGLPQGDRIGSPLQKTQIGSMVRRGALAPVPKAAGHGIIFMAASIRVPGGWEAGGGNDPPFYEGYAPDRDPFKTVTSLSTFSTPFTLFRSASMAVFSSSEPASP